MITIEILTISKKEYNFNEGMINMVTGNTIMDGLGCSKAELDRWLDVDKYVKNPHYKSASPMKLYNPENMALSDEIIQDWRNYDLKNGITKRISKPKKRSPHLIEIGKIASQGIQDIWYATIKITFKDTSLEGDIFVKTARNEKSARKKITDCINVSYSKFVNKRGISDKNIIAGLKRALKKLCFYKDFLKCMINGPQDYKTLNENDVKTMTLKLFEDYKNKRYETDQEIEQRKEQEFSLIKESIENTPEYVDYPSLFPLARDMKRHFIFHAGPTNSGKTHGALKELMSSDTGIYLAPLRLMAMEAYDKMCQNGIITNMFTGEERFVNDNAKHISCTIEMMETSVPMDIAIIDEVQLITDEDRGWAWTKAIVGCPAKKIIMTGSPEVGDYLKELIESLGDTYEEIHFQRLNALTIMEEVVTIKDLQHGDAIIAFSRRRVLELNQMLNFAGYNVACIYGSLSPEVRRKESERFFNGEAEILIATDAIGMGLNLPIKRVLFSSIQKYDGHSFRTLHGKEIRQIAGRAGRFNIDPEKNISGKAGVFFDCYDKYSATNNDLSIIDCELKYDLFSNKSKIHGYPVIPTCNMIRIISEKYNNTLTEVLEISEKLLQKNEKSIFYYNFSENNRKMAEIIQENSKRKVWEQYDYMGCPVRLSDVYCHLYFSFYLKKHKNEQSIVGIDLTLETNNLNNAESISTIASMYMWLSERYKTSFSEHDNALNVKIKADKVIEYYINKQYKNIRLKNKKQKIEEEQKTIMKQNICKTLIEEYRSGAVSDTTVENYIKTIYSFQDNYDFSNLTSYIVFGLKNGHLDIKSIPMEHNKKNKRLHKRIRHIIICLNEYGIEFSNQEKFV